MTDKKYAISFTAVRLDGKGNIGAANGVNIIHAPDQETANLAAMGFAINTCKPSEGFVGHIVSAMEVPADEVKQTDEVKQKKWFMP